jgi:hypothetical protein
MRYQFDLLVPAGTPQESPVELGVVLTEGTLTAVLIRFKAGAHRRVYVSVSDGLYQIAPAEGSDPLNGDDQIFELPMDYQIVGGENRLVLRGWSPYTLYEHLITFWFDLQTNEAAAKDAFLKMMQSIESLG